MRDNSDISVVVVTWEAEKNLGDCLASIFRQKPGKIIVVDAHSKDRTREIARSYGVQIVDDEGKTLGLARNIGLDQVQTPFVSYIGADNVITDGFFKLMVEDIKNNDWVGVQASIHSPKPYSNYYSAALDIYRRSRFKQGEASIVGTPYLFRSDILKKFRYNEFHTSSDDTELCYRLSKAGHRLGIGRAHCFEVGKDTREDLRRRWLIYGKSDYEFFNVVKDDLTFLKRLKSRNHAFFMELSKPLLSRAIRFRDKIFLLPFLSQSFFYRYRGFQLKKKKQLDFIKNW